MFSDRILELILQRKDVLEVPLSYRSTMIHAIMEVLEDEDALKERAKENGI